MVPFAFNHSSLELGVKRNIREVHLSKVSCSSYLSMTLCSDALRESWSRNIGAVIIVCLEHELWFPTVLPTFGGPNTLGQFGCYCAASLSSFHGQCTTPLTAKFAYYRPSWSIILHPRETFVASPRGLSAGPVFSNRRTVTGWRMLVELNTHCSLWLKYLPSYCSCICLPL